MKLPVKTAPRYNTLNLRYIKPNLNLQTYITKIELSQEYELIAITGPFYGKVAVP